MQRLNFSKDIADLVRKQKPKYTRFFQVYLSADSQVSQARLGVIIAKKAIPLAVNRNRLKRQIREYLSRQVIKTEPFCDILIISKPSVAKASKADLYADLAMIITLIRKL